MSSKRLIARIGSGAAPSASISTGSIASNASRAGGVRSERILPERQPSIRPRAPRARAPARDPRRRRRGLGEAGGGELRGERLGLVRQSRLAAFAAERVVER